MAAVRGYYYTERKAEIIRQYLLGKEIKELSIEYEISGSRVQEIIASVVRRWLRDNNIDKTKQKIDKDYIRKNANSIINYMSCRGPETKDEKTLRELKNQLKKLNSLLTSVQDQITTKLDRKKYLEEEIQLTMKKIEEAEKNLNNSSTRVLRE